MSLGVSMSDQKKTSNVSKMAVGIATGAGIGTAIGVGTENLAQCVGYGVALGVAIGAVWSKKAALKSD